MKSRFAVFSPRIVFISISIGLAISALCVFSHFSKAADDSKKTVIPFDYISKFDKGHYGELMGDLVWKRLSRDHMFVVPESMQDVREYCESHNFHPAPDIDLKKMKQVMQDDFDAQIAIWGSVERAPGEEAEIYDITLKCVDFSGDGDPKVIYSKSARTNSVSEIPHLYVKEMLDALAGRKPGEPPREEPEVAENWKKNPNLVVGGDFEHGIGKVPHGWEATAGQQREPLGKLVRWVPEKGSKDDPKPKNKVILFTLDKNVAENEGIMYYSKEFPVQEGAKYRFQCRWRSSAPWPKVFIKVYDADETGRRREVYRSQQNLKGKNNVWNTQTEDFTPKHTKYTPRWGRVMLYGYMSPGTIEWDDVVIKQIVPAPGNTPPKTRRLSKESDITIQDMQEDERRSQKLKSKEKSKAKDKDE